jgi:hypothetical protein
MHDPVSGAWYQCPPMYWIFHCPTCRGAGPLKLRCHAELGVAFRCFGKDDTQVDDLSENLSYSICNIYVAMLDG